MGKWIGAVILTLIFPPLGILAIICLLFGGTKKDMENFADKLNDWTKKLEEKKRQFELENAKKLAIENAKKAELEKIVSPERKEKARKIVAEQLANLKKEIL